MCMKEKRKSNRLWAGKGIVSDVWEGVAVSSDDRRSYCSAGQRWEE